MLCNRCGAQIPDDSLFCSKCGTPLSPAGTPYYQQPARPYYPDTASTGDRVGSFFLGLLSLPTAFLTAVVAIVLYIVYKPERPQKANAIAKWTAIGLLVSLTVAIVLAVVLFFIFSMSASAIISGLPALLS